MIQTTPMRKFDFLKDVWRKWGAFDRGPWWFVRPG
jgi:hypothetical protein